MGRPRSGDRRPVHDLQSRFRPRPPPKHPTDIAAGRPARWQPKPCCSPKVPKSTGIGGTRRPPVVERSPSAGLAGGDAARRVRQPGPPVGTIHSCVPPPRGGGAQCGSASKETSVLSGTARQRRSPSLRRARRRANSRRIRAGLASRLDCSASSDIGPYASFATPVSSLNEEHSRSTREALDFNGLCRIGLPTTAVLVDARLGRSIRPRLRQTIDVITRPSGRSAVATGLFNDRTRRPSDDSSSGSVHGTYADNRRDA